jgi:hypothetical protein
MAVDDAYSKVLHHFDGAEDGTVFTDESGKTWYRGGSAVTKASSKKFGATGLYCDGSSYIYAAASDADFNMGTGDWTLDCWFKTSDAENRFLFGQNNSSGSGGVGEWCGRIYDGVPYIMWGTFEKTANGPAGDRRDGLWHHYAAIRYGNNLYCAVDGVLGAATDVTGKSGATSGYQFAIGRYGEYTGGNNWLGSIDEFRLSKGKARWTANFTPPSIPYGFKKRQIIIF